MDSTQPQDDKNKLVFLTGTHRGVPIASIYLGNGDVTSSLRQFVQKEGKTSYRKFQSIEASAILELSQLRTKAFLGSLTKPAEADKEPLTSAQLVALVESNKEARWFFWIR